MLNAKTIQWYECIARNAKNDFEKDFKLMINAFFGKTIKNVRKCGDIKLEITAEKSSYVVSDPNYHTTKWHSEKPLAIKIRKK